MKIKFPILLCMALLAPLLQADAGEIIDRIVATVNGNIILQSDWDDAVRYEAFIDNRPLQNVTPADRKGALDRLIDQELLREQMRSSDFETTASEQDVARRVKDIRAGYATADNEPAWQAILARHHLSEAGLKHRVALQLDMLRLVDARLRPSIQIDSKSIESYYQEALLPQLREAGAAPVPLADVTPKIREVLTQQKLDQLLTAWLQNLRSTSQIRTQIAPEQGLAQ